MSPGTCIHWNGWRDSESRCAALCDPNSSVSANDSGAESAESAEKAPYFRVSGPSKEEALHAASNALRCVPSDLSPEAYKLGDEFKLFHPCASHVSPDYRDGWNRCWLAAQIEIAHLQAVYLERNGGTK